MSAGLNTYATSTLLLCEYNLNYCIQRPHNSGLCLRTRKLSSSFTDVCTKSPRTDHCPTSKLHLLCNRHAREQRYVLPTTYVSTLMCPTVLSNSVLAMLNCRQGLQAHHSGSSNDTPPKAVFLPQDSDPSSLTSANTSNGPAGAQNDLVRPVFHPSAWIHPVPLN